MLRQELGTACGGELNEHDAKTLTVTVYHGVDPTLPEVQKAAALIDKATSKYNQRHKLLLGNVVTSLHQLRITAASIGAAKDDSVTTLLGRAELELLRFIPRPGGEIEVVREDALDSAAKALRRPPRLLDRTHQPVAQLPLKWKNVYCAGLTKAMASVLASHTVVKKYNREMEVLVDAFPDGTLRFAQSTGGSMARNLPARALRRKWEGRPANECTNTHDVFCLFTVAMCLKFFYMWRKTTRYLQPVERFLENYRSAFAKPTDGWAARRLMDLCDEPDIVIATQKLVGVMVDDDMRTACGELMSAISQFMNGVYCRYLEQCDGLATKIASMTGAGEDGLLEQSAIFAMYEDNEDVLWRLPVACSGYERNADGTEVLLVDWDDTVNQDDRRVDEGKQHLRGLVAEMCSNKRMSKEMEARLSGYIALAHSPTKKGGAMLTGHCIFGTFEAHGEVRSVSVFNSKSDDALQYFQAATTVSVGTEDVGVVTWCPSTARRISNVTAPPDTGDFGSLSHMQLMIEDRLDELGTKQFGTAQAHEFQRLHGVSGRLRGRVYNATEKKVYRVTTWEDGVMLLVPEPWIQQCFWDLAHRKAPPLHRRPYMCVVGSLGKARDGLKRANITNDFWLQHTHDQLAGLAVEWEQQEILDEASDRRTRVWLLREDRQKAEIVAM
jgi:hypothetical protein